MRKSSWVVKEIRKNTYRKYYRPGTDEVASWTVLTAIMLGLVILMTRALILG